MVFDSVSEHKSEKKILKIIQHCTDYGRFSLAVGLVMKRISFVSLLISSILVTISGKINKGVIMFTKRQYFTTILMLFSLFITSISSAQTAPPRVSFGLAAMAGKGTMGNGLVDAPDRDMMFVPISFFAGFNIKKIRIGVNYEYMMGNQTTDPVDVANTNVTGTGSSLGARVDYYSGVQSFGIVYRASDSYSLEKQTFAGTTATYKGTGLSVQYMRQLRNRFGFIIDYTTGEFKESLSTGNVKWNRVGLGIVFSNFPAKGR